MTAEEARLMTKNANSPRTEDVQAVLQLWNDAIERAARNGQSSVRESGLPSTRCLIDGRSRVVALEQLRRDGFAVVVVTDGPNETTVEVSWSLRKIAPPKGGTGTPPKGT